MRHLLATFAALITLAACELYAEPEPTAADAIEQCHELADLFCVAADECGWDANTGPCRAYYGAMCERNLTLVSQQTMTLARQSLARYECAQNEAWILFPNEQGRYVLDAMLAWPESPASD